MRYCGLVGPDLEWSCSPFLALGVVRSFMYAFKWGGNGGVEAGLLSEPSVAETGLEGLKFSSIVCETFSFIDPWFSQTG